MSDSRGQRCCRIWCDILKYFQKIKICHFFQVQLRDDELRVQLRVVAGEGGLQGRKLLGKVITDHSGKRKPVSYRGQVICFSSGRDESIYLRGKMSFYLFISPIFTWGWSHWKWISFYIFRRNKCILTFPVVL